MHARPMVLALLLVVAGCGGGTTGTDMGGSDSGGTDGGGTDGGGTDGGRSDASTADIAHCMSSAATLMATCPSDGTRTCQVGAYGSYCNASANPGAFADALDCLLAMSSSSGGCRTFSDPSGAAACVTMAFSHVTSPDADHIAMRVNMLCTDAGVTMPTTTEPPLYALSPSQLSTAKSCVDAATTCDMLTPCVQAFQGPIQACFATP